MSRRVVSKTPQARLDLIEAGLYIAEGNPEAADRFHDALNKTLQRLLQHPQLGRARPELGRELRSFPHRQYVIYYRPTDRGVEVVRVLHGARDIPPLFEEDL
jgi:toxin ParE1/3/4